jgi:hypothetical protein
MGTISTCLHLFASARRIENDAYRSAEEMKADAQKKLALVPRLVSFSNRKNFQRPGLVRSSGDTFRSLVGRYQSQIDASSKLLCQPIYGTYPTYCLDSGANLGVEISSSETESKFPQVKAEETGFHSELRQRSECGTPSPFRVARHVFARSRRPIFRVFQIQQWE